MATVYVSLFLLGTISSVLASQGQQFFNFAAADADGVIAAFEKYRGKVTMVTNVASYCGFTDGHYKDYVHLKEEYGSWLNILAFPCNQFGQQEPEDVSTIVSNMRSKYDINFEIFGKIDVVGENVPEFWKYLNEESQTVPQWNFYKYLVDHRGQVLGAWGPKVDVGHVKSFIEEAIRRAQNYKEEL